MDQDVQRANVEEALLAEHGRCWQNFCDIDMAREQGYTFWAAELLSGATETPILDAALAQIPDWRARAQAEIPGFAAWYKANTVPCDNCGSYVREDNLMTRAELVCGNCLATIRPAR